MFVVSGMTLAWHAAMAAPGLGAALGTLISMLGVMPLAALLVFTGGYWYSGHDAAAYGLTDLEDQQLGGALMWFPGSLAYLVAIAIVLLRRLAGQPDATAPVRRRVEPGLGRPQGDQALPR
jgi:putative membrane protein